MIENHLEEFLQLQELHSNKSITVSTEGETVPATFLTPQAARAIRAQFGSPVFVYSEEAFCVAAERATSMPSAFGLTARFAMKALPNQTIIALLYEQGVKIDASSGYEAERAMAAGVRAADIQLTAQQLPTNLQALIESGVQFNACSLNQLKAYGQLFPGSAVCVRLNPGLGSGHNNRTNVGGVSSAFGIWHEYIPEVHAVLKQYDLKATAVHSHIGSGSDAAVWARCAALTLNFVHEFPDVTTVNLGGGFKVARMPGEESTDLHVVGRRIAEQFETFKNEDTARRELHLEIEPGSFYTVNSGILLSTVIDTKDTGKNGYKFLLVDTGMTEILRPSLYGAQHPIAIVPATHEMREQEEYLVAGHCCESGDMLTPAPGDPEGLHPRTLIRSKVGDLCIIAGAGAYCSAMAATSYNSYPLVAELLLRKNGEVQLIRGRQAASDVYSLEREGCA